MGISHSDLPAHVLALMSEADRSRIARPFRSLNDVSADLQGVPTEVPLHYDILDYCRQRGWIAFHGSMAHRAHRTVGEPDFIILGDDGRMWLLECKSKTGKLSPPQAALAAMARHLGHTVHLVRSMNDFHRVIQGLPCQKQDESEAQ